jgi:hypothetical protein
MGNPLHDGSTMASPLGVPNSSSQVPTKYVSLRSAWKPSRPGQDRGIVGYPQVAFQSLQLQGVKFENWSNSIRFRHFAWNKPYRAWESWFLPSGLVVVAKRYVSKGIITLISKGENFISVVMAWKTHHQWTRHIKPFSVEIWHTLWWVVDWP